MANRDLVDTHELEKLLYRIDGRSYGGYKQLYRIMIDYDLARGVFTKIQGDPYAKPSILELHIPWRKHGFPDEFFKPEHIIPFTDYIARYVAKVTRRLRRRCGSGNSCYIGIPTPGPCILKRSCVETRGETILIRLFIGLPASGRRILGDQARYVLIDAIRSLLLSVIDLNKRVTDIARHIVCYLEQEAIRKWLKKNDYLFFVVNNSILPRESSISYKPKKDAVKFRSPKTLEKTIFLPSGRRVTGMAIPKGVIVITGGGYHGKTTLLKALQEGIYNHIRGDGREYVVSRDKTIIVEAENGRLVWSVDISSFIKGLEEADTSNYTSLNASGTTSMAASLTEAIELGAEAILIDEDTSATNLLFKDRVMEKIIHSDPIVPLSSQARSIVEKTGAGLVIVSSASSAFLDKADHVVLMRKYVPFEITDEVKKINSNYYGSTSIDYNPPSKKRYFYGIRGLKKIRAKGYRLLADYINGETFELDLSKYNRIVEKTQVRFLAYIIRRIAYMGKPIEVNELAKHVDDVINKKGFEAFAKPVTPDLAMVTGFDVVWVLNRFYNSIFRQK
ncbi:MAG: ABC-ATPase domain-containing protein [Desulfurococcales archaeon]|nr:ABC-ATPase domain-containing protein [Desulfurococcales archaeon]